MIADPLRAAVLLLACLLAGCAAQPQGSALAARFERSPNIDPRRVALVVLHHTGTRSAAEALRALTSPAAQVSAHYLVDRRGAIVQLVDERERAWHAGESRWAGIEDVNSASIGIELDNDGAEPYPPAQVDALLRLLADLRERHRLGPSAFVGHADVAPARKADPGALFPWRTLAANGFGLWCDPPYPPAPLGFDLLLGLRALGYDVRQPEAALAAFRLHHALGVPADPSGARDADLAACLLQRALPAP